MDETAMTQYIISTFPHVETQDNLGYTFFFYKSERVLPFASLISADTEYDRISNLDRPGVYRLNLGISKQTFQSLFGTDRIDPARYDYTALNTIMPHPDYAPQSFICVLSPNGKILEQVQSLLAQAYDIAVKRFERRNPQ